MYSVYHLFKDLVDKSSLFKEIINLEDFPFDTNLLSCKNKGQFPDLAIKVNHGNTSFTGGELIELKDSKSYSIASFNSTIPTGKKSIDAIIKSDNSCIRKQMEENGNHIFDLPERDVFYMVRGKNKGNVKVVLIHGSFFETVKSNELISRSFEQVLTDRLNEKGLDIGNLKDILVDIFSEQENFSKVRNVDKASVKLRFRIMTEIKAEGNILNTKQYPQIADNSISLIIPRHSDTDEEIAMQRFNTVFKNCKMDVFNIKHHLNGYFIVFNTKI
jgi:hypothetical protein